MRILFLFAMDWSKEIVDYERGLVPSHRNFGYVEVKKMGHEPIACRRPAPLRTLLSRPPLWRVYQALWAALQQRSADAIFAVNEAAALPLLVLKRLGLLRTPVMVFNVGLTHSRNLSGHRRKMWHWLLPCAEAVISQTQREFEDVAREFGLRADRQFLLHMLVDMDFFKADPDVPAGDYCLSVGTSGAKDFPTLLEAFPRGEKLVIVTDPYNARLIEQHIEPGMAVEVRQAIPIDRLKRMYQEARLTITPLLETAYGSGHTVVLENMALGKPVIVSHVSGMREYFEDGVSAIGYRVGDVEDLRAKIRAYLDDPAKFAHIGRQSRDWVSRFSSEKFAGALIEIARKSAPPKARRRELKSDPSPPA